MDALQQRWEVAWAQKQELDEEQARFMATMTTMDEAMADRILEVLRVRRHELQEELLAIRAAWLELGRDELELDPEEESNSGI